MSQAGRLDLRQLGKPLEVRKKIFTGPPPFMRELQVHENSCFITEQTSTSNFVSNKPPVRVRPLTGGAQAASKKKPPQSIGAKMLKKQKEELKRIEAEYMEEEADKLATLNKAKGFTLLGGEVADPNVTVARGLAVGCPAPAGGVHFINPDGKKQAGGEYKPLG